MPARFRIALARRIAPEMDLPLGTSSKGSGSGWVCQRPETTDPVYATGRQVDGAGKNVRIFVNISISGEWRSGGALASRITRSTTSSARNNALPTTSFSR